MSISFKYKQPKTDSGALRTSVKFYGYQPSDSPEPNQAQKTVLHECFAEVYNPSMKDMEIMRVAGTKEGATIRIRDTFGEYIPSNEHSAKIEDYRYKDKMFEVVEVGPDLQDNRFIKIILGRYS